MPVLGLGVPAPLGSGRASVYLGMRAIERFLRTEVAGQLKLIRQYLLVGTHGAFSWQLRLRPSKGEKF